MTAIRNHVKKVTAAALCTLVLGSAAATTAVVASNAPSAIVSAATASSKISKSKAISTIKKSYSNLKNSNLIAVSKVDDGMPYYKVIGSSNTRNYEIEVDAQTGKIHSVDWTLKTIQQGKKNLTAAQARKVVNAKITAQKNQSRYQSEVDYVRGIKCYEIEFETATREYDVVVNATTGKLYSVDWESKTELGSTGSKSSGAMNKTKALQIALKDAKKKFAGLKQSNIYALDIEADTENGVKIYSVEFKYNGYEFEYEINRTTGKILEKDISFDD